MEKKTKPIKKDLDEIFKNNILPYIKKAMQTKKGKQAKDKRSAKKVVGTLQTNYKTKIFKCVLHVRKEWVGWEQLAYGAFMGEGILRGVFKIRFESAKTAVLQLQYQPWGSRGRILPQNVHNRGSRVYGKVSSRQTSISKRNDSLPKTPYRLPKDFGRFRE